MSSRLASSSSSVEKPSLRHSAATSSASCAAFASGLLVYLLLPMHSATWLGSAAGALKVTFMPRDAMAGGTRLRLTRLT